MRQITGRLIPVVACFGCAMVVIVVVARWLLPLDLAHESVHLRGLSAPVSVRTTTRSLPVDRGLPKATAVQRRDVVPGLSKEANWDEVLRGVRRWAAHDFTAAFAWATVQTDPTQRRDALVAACYGLAESDPAAALSLTEQLNLDDYAASLSEDIVQQWMEADPVKTLRWIATEATEQFRPRVVERAAFVLSKTEPAIAAQLVTDEIRSDASQTEAVIMVIHQWAKQDADAAARWVDRFPPGLLRQRAEQELGTTVGDHATMTTPSANGESNSL